MPLTQWLYIACERRTTYTGTPTQFSSTCSIIFRTDFIEVVLFIHSPEYLADSTKGVHHKGIQ